MNRTLELLWDEVDRLTALVASLCAVVNPDPSVLRRTADALDSLEAVRATIAALTGGEP